MHWTTALSVIGELAGIAGAVVGVLYGLDYLSRIVMSAKLLFRSPPLATGDSELAAILGTLTNRRTRKLAVIVVNRGAEPRFAFVDADADTRFEIGSLSKVFTGMLIAREIAQGHCTLATTLKEMDPGIPAGLADITVKQLTTHTSGLPSLPNTTAMVLRSVSGNVRNLYGGITAAQIIAAAARSKRSPAGRYGYSNLGAALAGNAAAAHDGTTYGALLRQQILSPLGMTDTTVAADRKPMRRGWRNGALRAPLWVMDGYAPAGGLVSTPTDIGRFARALVEHTAPGLDSLKPILSIGPSGAVGMFWMLDQPRHRAWHNGETGGYSGYLTFRQDAGQVVAVLANTTPAEEPQRIAAAIRRAIG